MKNQPDSSARIRRFVASAILTLAPLFLPAGHAAPASAVPAAPALLDDFSDAARDNRGAARILVDDHTLGSQSHATPTCAGGILAVQGELAPGRGVPAFISLVLPASPDGRPQDLSAYTGVRLRVKIIQGTLSVQVGSSAIQNFDYHTGPAIVRTPDAFQEVRVPFQDLRRAWSEQVPLDPATITSVNLVAFGMARGAFSYEVDEIGFY